ncbi:MAG: IS1 family transposase [Deltaproteobacteria bacterium]|nr:MAG: IS1 family transposase [Deltaproteobacteria bacterium]
MPTDIKCPSCAADAVYKYGKTYDGKQRYICQVCNRQFSGGSLKKKVDSRPKCPECKSNMHVYKREDDIVRYRCARYPDCRTFKKQTRRTENAC